MSESAFAIAVITFLVAAAAFTIWASVRLMNQRKQPRRFWIAVFVAELTVLYPLLFLPACWLSSRVQPSGRAVSIIYRPVIWVIDKSEVTVHARMRPLILMGCPEGTVLRGNMGEIAFLTGQEPTAAPGYAVLALTILVAVIAWFMHRRFQRSLKGPPG